MVNKMRCNGFLVMIQKSVQVDLASKSPLHNFLIVLECKKKKIQEQSVEESRILVTIITDYESIRNRIKFWQPRT